MNLHRIVSDLVMNPAKPVVPKADPIPAPLPSVPVGSYGYPDPVLLRRYGLTLQGLRYLAPTVWERRYLLLSESLTPTQGTLNPDIVGKYVGNANATPFPAFQDPDPILVAIDGRLLIANGHHRIAAARIRGGACPVG